MVPNPRISAGSTVAITGLASSLTPYTFGATEAARGDVSLKLTNEVISIGIGGSLAAPPLPHHRTYGSRIRRFGGFSGRSVSQPDVAIPVS